MQNTVTFKIQVTDDGQFKVLTGDAGATLDVIRNIQKQAAQMSSGVGAMAGDNAAAMKKTTEEAQAAAKAIANTYERVVADIRGAISEGTTSFRENIRLQKKEVADLEKQYEALKRSRDAAYSKGEKSSISAEMSRVGDELFTAREALRAFEDEQAKLDASSVSVRTQLLNLRNEMAKLRMEGKKNTAEYEERRAEMERLGTTYRELQTEQLALSTGATQIGGIITGVQGLMGVYSMGTGVVSMFTDSNENLMKVQTKMQSVMSIMMGLQQASNALHSTSAFRIVTVRKATELWSAGVRVLTTNLKLSTTAARIFQGVLTGGITIAIGAVISLTSRLVSKKKEEKEAIRTAAEEQKKQAESVRTTVSNSIASQLVEYKKLQKGWRDLGEDMSSKSKFVLENQEAFRKLGVEVNDVAAAENLLIDNEGAFIASLKNRALAAAAMELATAKYKEAIAKMLEAEQVTATPEQRKAASKEAYDAYAAAVASADGILNRGIVSGQRSQIVNKAYRESLSKMVGGVVDGLRAEGRRLMAEGDRFFAQAQAAGLKADKGLSAAGIATGSARSSAGAGTDSTTPELEVKEGSIAQIEERLRAYRAALKAASADERAAIQADIIVWENKLAAINESLDAMSISSNPETLSELTAAIAFYEKRMNNATGDEIQEINKTIQKYKEKRKAILDSVSGVEEAVAEVIDSLGLEQNLYLTLTARVENAEEAAKKIRELQALAAVAQTNEEKAAIAAAIASWQKYATATTEVSRSGEGAGQVMSALSSTVGAFSGVVDDSAAGWLTWSSNLLSAIAQAIPSIVALTTAKKAEANANTEALVTGAGAAVSSIPFVGPIMAIAAIASVIAALASIPKFASGAIAYGPTLGIFGEYAGAANNPEVVAPLDKLRSLIGGAGGGDVRFKIRGRDLVGLIEKEYHINSRVE